MEQRSPYQVSRTRWLSTRAWKLRQCKTDFTRVPIKVTILSGCSQNKVDRKLESILSPPVVNKRSYLFISPEETAKWYNYTKDHGNIFHLHLIFLLISLYIQHTCVFPDVYPELCVPCEFAALQAMWRDPCCWQINPSQPMPSPPH